MRTLTVKLPVALSARVARLAKAKRASQSEIVRDALESYTGNERPSFTEAAAEFCGVAEGPRDLATNPRYLKGYGK